MTVVQPMGSLLWESKTRPVSAPDSALTVVAHVPIQTQQAQNVLRILGENPVGFRSCLSLYLITKKLFVFVVVIFSRTVLCYVDFKGQRNEVGVATVVYFYSNGRFAYSFSNNMKSPVTVSFMPINFGN